MIEERERQRETDRGDRQTETDRGERETDRQRQRQRQREGEREREREREKKRKRRVIISWLTKTSVSECGEEKVKMNVETDQLVTGNKWP